VIAFDGVCARYPGAASRALDGVTFSAANGSVTAITGPNGSGKSTLVRALIRRIPLESGVIRVDGDPARALSHQEMARRVAVVVQREEPAFPMRVREYVSLGRFPSIGLWRAASADDHGAVSRAGARAGIDSLMERSTDELSGGEWQRVRIARALAQESRALVLDEPTTFLDLAHEMSLFELVHSLTIEGMTVLVVSHQLNLVARFASRVILLDRGKVVAAGSPDEVMKAGLLEQVYRWPVVVARDPVVGAPALVPLRKRSTSTTHEP
jgi:iron complex transport system ATP-binding protein